MATAQPIMQPPSDGEVMKNRPVLRNIDAVQRRPLYTAAERIRRDESRWTLVQGVLAPIQFLVFAISVTLVLRTLLTGEGASIAAMSVVLKTALLYTIMITGSIWEKVVFGKWLFAPAFFWEDVVSMLVLALHSAYLIAYFSGWGSEQDQMLIALAAYLSYLINAGQFLYKLRQARLEAAAPLSQAADQHAASMATPA